MSQRTRRHLSLALPPAEPTPAAGAAGALPGNLVRLLLTQAEDLLEEEDPIQAELWCSDVLGAVWAATDGDSAAEASFADAWVCAAAADEDEPEAALCALTALSTLAGSPNVRREAAVAADRLAALGVPRPRWADAVDALTVGECWRYGDVFGDQETILCSFDRQEREHAMLVLIDHTLGGLAKDVFFTNAVGSSVQHLREELADTPVAFLEPIEPAAARRRLQRAFTATDERPTPPIHDELVPNRAMALARVRQLPHAVATASTTRPGPAALVEEFLGSPEAAALPSADPARRWAELLVDRAVDRDDAPGRVGPGLLDDLLLTDVPEHALLDASARQAMPAVLTAWTRWAARRQGLTAAATLWLENALEQILDEFPDAYRAPEAVAHRNSCPETVDLRIGHAGARLTVARS